MIEVFGDLHCPVFLGVSVSGVKCLEVSFLQSSQNGIVFSHVRKLQYVDFFVLDRVQGHSQQCADMFRCGTSDDAIGWNRQLPDATFWQWKVDVSSQMGVFNSRAEHACDPALSIHQHGDEEFDDRRIVSSKRSYHFGVSEWVRGDLLPLIQKRLNVILGPQDPELEFVHDQRFRENPFR